MLGEAMVAEGKRDVALVQFEKEIVNYEASLNSQKKFPFNRERINHAAAYANLRMAEYYVRESTKRNRARDYFNEYLRLETDTDSRTKAIEEFNKFGIQGPSAPL
jgi:hypothetical protein